MTSLSLKTELRQQLQLTPQLMQSMELLQMNSSELLEYINQVAEENPVIECEDPQDLQNDFERLLQTASRFDSAADGSSIVYEQRNPESITHSSIPDGLHPFLTDQLDRLHLSKPLLALTKHMVLLIDEDGYLPEEDLADLQKLDLPFHMVSDALRIIQQLEPAGVGAGTLSECLLLQLRRKGLDSPVITKIVGSCLPELGRKQYGAISRKLGISREDILSAEAVIAELDPRPGEAFQSEASTIYTRPDIFVVEENGQLKVLLDESYLPRISISDYYLRLFRESKEKETADYLREKLRQARWVLDGLNRRKNTLQSCAEAIVSVQQEFFLGHTQELRPMNLVSLSHALELHPSTVSRATRGKYIQCRQGIFPLRYFFNRSCGENVSTQAVKQKLLLLIRSEDPQHPLSDQTLCALLLQEGISVSRRTVAKYRMELGIPSSPARRNRTIP